VDKITKLKKSSLIKLGLLNDEDVDKAITECNFIRGTGLDEFEGSCPKTKRFKNA